MDAIGLNLIASRICDHSSTIAGKYRRVTAKVIVAGFGIFILVMVAMSSFTFVVLTIIKIPITRGIMDLNCTTITESAASTTVGIKGRMVH